MSSSCLRAAVIQMSPGSVKSANLEKAEGLIARAVEDGAQLVSLPETFLYSGSHSEADMQAISEEIPGPTSQWMSKLAKKHDIYFAGGSIFETNPENPARAFNTSLVYDPKGNLLAKYRKNHLFSFEDEKKMSEASYQMPGKPEDLAVAKTPWGGMGLSICYDLRFPLMYQHYARSQEATMLMVPSKFLRVTGSHHWLPLLQARAIENQCFVIAANGCSEGKPAEYGHSLIIDPWGEILAQLPTGEGYACADLDFDRLASVRSKLPVLQTDTVMRI